jgi:hypothetical protein
MSLWRVCDDYTALPPLSLSMKTTRQRHIDRTTRWRGAKKTNKLAGAPLRVKIEKREKFQVGTNFTYN